jgi:broad specificity phosphatase PhoE
MIYLYLVSQPQSTWEKEDRCEGLTDTSITPFGKKQTFRIAKFFSDKQVDGLITSSLNRSIQTAKLLQKTLTHKPKRDPRLNDANRGSWTGKFQEEIEGRYPASWQQWQQDPEQVQWPDGESFEQVKTRVESFLSDIYSNELFDKYYIVLTHDIIITLILSIIEKRKYKETLGKYLIQKGSITLVKVYPEKEIIEYNITGHLYV